MSTGDDDEFMGFPEEPGGGKINDMNDESAFIKVIKRKRLNVEGQAAPTSVSNRFGSLNNDTSEHEVIRTSENAPISANGNADKRSKVPPMTVTEGRIYDLIDHVKKNLPASVYENQNVKYKLTSNGIRVIINSVENFKIVRDMFIKTKVKFYSHPLDEERTVKFVVHGLDDSTDMVALKQNLSEQGITPISITKLKIRQKKFDEQAIFLLHFYRHQNMTLEKLRTIRAIECLIVRFERYMFHRNGITQCSNCLRFSHGAKNCHLPPRCIRCGENHASANCEKKIDPKDPSSKIPKSQVKCANCQRNHTANYEKCTTRLEYVANTRKSPPTKPRTAPPMNANIIQDMRSSHRAPRSSSNFINHQSFANVLKPTGDLYSPADCYKIFKSFLNEISKCKSKTEQVDTIVRLTLEFINRDDSP